MLQGPVKTIYILKDLSKTLLIPVVLRADVSAWVIKCHEFSFLSKPNFLFFFSLGSDAGPDWTSELTSCLPNFSCLLMSGLSDWFSQVKMPFPHTELKTNLLLKWKTQNKVSSKGLTRHLRSGFDDCAMYFSLLRFFYPWSHQQN